MKVESRPASRNRWREEAVGEFFGRLAWDSKRELFVLAIHAEEGRTYRIWLSRAEAWDVAKACLEGLGRSQDKERTK